jgi:hypothetical protein
MAYLDQWKTAKKLFETATGKKKPGPKFAGAFRQSTGLESATKNLDAALLKRDAATLDRAEKDFVAAWERYTASLERAAKDDKGDHYKDELKRLDAALARIHSSFLDERERAASGANDSQVAAMKRKADDIALHAKQVVERLRSDKTAILKVVGEIDVLLVAMVDAQQAGDTKTLRAKRTLVAGKVQEADAIYQRDVKHVEAARQARTKSLAEIAAYEKKSGVKIVDRAFKDSKIDPFFDQADITLEEIREQAQKAHALAVKAAAAEKHGLDVAAVFLSRVQTYVRRVREARQNLYAQHVLIVDFGDEAVAAYEKAARAAEPARTQQLKVLRQQIRQRDYHGRVGSEFLSQLNRQVGALYADQILSDSRVRNVPNARQDIDDAAKVLAELERLSTPVEKAINKIKAVVARLPA